MATINQKYSTNYNKDKRKSHSQNPMLQTAVDKNYMTTDAKIRNIRSEASEVEQQQLKE